MGDVRTYVVCILLFVIVRRCWSLSVAVVFALWLWSIVLVIRRSWLRVTVIRRHRGSPASWSLYGCGRGCIMTRGALPVGRCSRKEGRTVGRKSGGKEDNSTSSHDVGVPTDLRIICCGSLTPHLVSPRLTHLATVLDVCKLFYCNSFSYYFPYGILLY